MVTDMGQMLLNPNPSGPKPGEWLSLRDAAKQLGVHPNTLQRWADKGEIPVQLTPEGRRQFAVFDLNAFTAQHHHRRQASSRTEQAGAECVPVHTCNRLWVQQHALQLPIVDPEACERSQLLGRRLLGVILHYVSTGTEADGLIGEARAIGHGYAHDAIEIGWPLTTALEATMVFRDIMVEVAAQLLAVTNLPPTNNTRLLRQISAVLNAVQLAIADTYDRSGKLTPLSRLPARQNKLDCVPPVE